MDLNVFKGIRFWLSVGIGTLAVTTTLVSLYFWRNKSKSKRAITLKDPNVKYPLKLIEKIHLSPDTRLFRFELPSPNHILGLPVGQHVYLSAVVNGQLVVRNYTPVSTINQLGHMDLIIKIYNGQGEFAIRADNNKKAPAQQIIRAKKINMIAGGSGITPMLQLIKAIFADKSDISELSLVYANKTENDILCRSDLENIHREYPNRFKLWYTLSQTQPENWKYSSGHINLSILKDNFYAPSNDTFTLICGPPGMVNSACIPALDKLGYDSKLRFVC